MLRCSTACISHGCWPFARSRPVLGAVPYYGRWRDKQGISMRLLMVVFLANFRSSAGSVQSVTLCEWVGFVLIDASFFELMGFVLIELRLMFDSVLLIIFIRECVWVWIHVENECMWCYFFDKFNFWISKKEAGMVRVVSDINTYLIVSNWIFNHLTRK